MNQKGGISDIKILFLTLVLFSVVFLVYSSFFSIATLDFGDATNITATGGSDNVDNGTAGGQSEIINLTVSGLGTTGNNITHINITLPAGNYTFLNFMSGGEIIGFVDQNSTDQGIGTDQLTNVTFYPDGNATTWGCFNASATLITCNTSADVGTDGTDALGGGANNTLIITFNVTAASDVTEHIANIQIDTSSNETFDSLYSNTTVVNLTIDGVAPRLLDINITDGNTTLLNGTAILNLSITDPGSFLSKNASNLTVTLNIQEHAIDTILFYYNCTSVFEVSNVSQVVGAYFNPEGQGGVKANYSYKADRGAGTSGVVVATETVAYNGVIDSTCFNNVGAANFTTLIVIANDSFGNERALNVSSEELTLFVGLNTTADGTPTFYSINVTDATSTLSGPDSVDGSDDYLKGGNHTFEIELSSGPSVNLTEVVLVYNTTSTVTLGANGFYDAAADNAVTLTDVRVNSGSQIDNGTKAVVRAAVDFGTGNDTITVSFGWVANATGGIVDVEDDALYTVIAGPFSYQIDSADPSPTLTEPVDKTIDVRATIKYTCTGSDTTSGIKEYKATLTKPGGTTVVKTATLANTEFSFTGDDTNEAGTYTVECKVTDKANNEKATTASFTALYATGAAAPSGGAGGAAVEGVTFDVDFSQPLVTEASVRVAEGSTRTFSFDGRTTHTLRVDVLSDTSATITVSSTPQTFILNVGESRKVDLNEDGLNDLEVVLNSIDRGVADLSLKKIEEGAAIVAEEERAAAEAEEAVAPVEEVAPAPVEERRVGTIVAVVVIVIIVVLLIVYYFMRKK